MSLRIHSVDAKKEKVWLEASSPVNLLGHAIVDNTFTADNKTSNEYRHIYIFPAQAVTAKDYVCLHSGEGKNSVSPENNSKGGKTYHFYWKAKGAVWNNNGRDKAQLIQYSVISTKAAT